MNETPRERLDELFRQAGVIADLFAIDAYPDEALWKVTVDDSVIVFSELDEKRGVFVLSTNLGSPRQEEETKIQALALRYNHIWPESGGARVSMDAEAGSLWLLMDLSIASLTSSLLGEAICGFAQITRAWQNLIVTQHQDRPLAHATAFATTRPHKPIS